MVDYASERSRRSEESYDNVAPSRGEPLDPDRTVVVGRINERRTLRIALEHHALRGDPLKIVLEGPSGQGVTTMESFMAGLAKKHGYLSL